MADMDYSGFGRKLHHDVPAWVECGAKFHVRIRCANNHSIPLTTDEIATRLLNAAKFYEHRSIWQIQVFLLMPNHLHAILIFAKERQMRRVVGDWKRYVARETRIEWQENFFDHRLRDEQQFALKLKYVLNNPVVLRLCDSVDDWPYKIVRA